MSEKKETVEVKIVDQEPKVLVSEDTEKILARHGVTNTVTQDELDAKGDKKTADEVVKTAVVVEDEQVAEQEQDVTITDEEFNILETAGITEEQLDGKTFGEIKQLVVDNTPAQETEDKVSQDEGIITEAMVEKYGFAKSLIGQPMTTAFEALDNQNKYITNLELLNKAQTDSQAQTNKNTNTEEKKIDEPIVDLLNLKPEEQRAELNKIIQAGVKTGVATEMKKLAPTLQPLQELSEDQAIEKFYGRLGEKLPEGAKPEEVFKQWHKDHGKEYTTKELQTLANNANILITVVTKDYQTETKAQAVVKTEKQIEDEVKEKSYKKVRQALTGSQKLGSNAKFNFKRKEGVDDKNDLLSDEGTPAEQMYGAIIDRNLPK